ncbi:MAG TPA: hypothetical protein VOA41_00545 [Candidatus Dormibacteraeota bacterium]|nr:hypothetical protein [Candidatus Dormibacteraeota bacterium]
MDAMMVIGQIAGTLMLSICAGLGIEWIFLAGAFRLMSAALTRTPTPQPALPPRRAFERGPALWL